jgi:hypothetical protein
MIDRDYLSLTDGLEMLHYHAREMLYSSLHLEVYLEMSDSTVYYGAIWPSSTLLCFYEGL